MLFVSHYFIYKIIFIAKKYKLKYHTAIHSLQQVFIYLVFKPKQKIVKITYFRVIITNSNNFRFISSSYQQLQLKQLPLQFNYFLSPRFFYLIYLYNLNRSFNMMNLMNHWNILNIMYFLDLLFWRFLNSNILWFHLNWRKLRDLHKKLFLNIIRAGLIRKQVKLERMLKDFIAKLGRPKKIILASVSSLTLKNTFCIIKEPKIGIIAIMV